MTEAASAQYIAVIGAANIDIIGSSRGPVIMEDSNPGSVHMCAGGVGRNIAENIARLGTGVKLICALGDDVFGQTAVRLSEEAGVDMSCCYVSKGCATGVYMAIMDNAGEMKLAVSDMRACAEMPPEAAGRHRDMINNAAVIVLDANLPEAVLEYITDEFAEKRIIIDPVSVGKAKHMKRLTGRFDTIKMNRMEAEFLSGIQIQDIGGLKRAGEFFLSKGTRRVFITLGKDGAFYQNAGEAGICGGPYLKPANATGAGDAFTAAVAFCSLHGYDDSYTARFACAMSRVALRSLQTVSSGISKQSVLNEMNEMEKD